MCYKKMGEFLKELKKHKVQDKLFEQFKKVGTRCRILAKFRSSKISLCRITNILRS